MYCRYADRLVANEHGLLATRPCVRFLHRWAIDSFSISVQVHSDIIATLKAAGADSRILDRNGHSAEDFDVQHEEQKGLPHKSTGSVTGRLEPPRSKSGANPSWDAGDEL